MIKFLLEEGTKDNYYAWYYISPEEVLDLVEKAGMLPPPIVQYGTYEGIIEHGKVIPECESEDKFRWESENEAK